MNIDLNNSGVQLLVAMFMIETICWSIWFGSDADADFVSGVVPVMLILFFAVLAIRSMSSMVVHELWPPSVVAPKIEHAGPPLMP